MKTPRELLLARHRAAEPRLDTIRQAVVGGLNRQAAQPPTRTADFLNSWFRGPNTLWRELVLPCRRIWTGLAAVWFFLLIVNVSQRDPASSVAGHPMRSSAMMLSWQVQQRWVDELLVERSESPKTERPRNAPPRPRTEENEGMFG